ncbi:MAG: protein-L-isoaspartate O-methyltransferase family protein [Xanthobacteraceae bacterium]
MRLMIDYAAARRTMVDSQIRTCDVTDLRIVGVMLELPRERFVPQAHAELAYLDGDVPLAAAGEAAKRRLLRPMVLAKLVQALAIGPQDHVLDVGCATGYASALLGRLAGSVVALEDNAELALQAKTNLAACNVRNVTVATGPLTEGLPAQAPYDVILINGAVEFVPEALRRQVKEGGRLATMLGRSPLTRGMLYHCIRSDLSGRSFFDAPAPMLPGFAAEPQFVF